MSWFDPCCAGKTGFDCLIGFVCFRVVTCGLELVGKQDRDTKEIESQNRVGSSAP